MKSALNKKFLRSAALIGLTGAISLSSIGTIFAKDPTDAKGRHGVFGSVTAKGEHSFDLKTRAGANVTFAVTGSTKFRIPGDETPAFADIKVGSNVAVLGERSDDGALALHVLMIPNEVRREHRVLRVIEIDGRTIIAQDADGNRVEVKLEHEVSADIKGMLVTFIGERSEASNKFKANTEIKIEQVIKRLENISNKLDEDVKKEANEKAREEKQKDSIDIKSRLKANMESHIAFFEKLIERAPESAKPSLKEALEKTIAGYRAEMEAIEKLGDQLNETRKINVVNGIVAGVSDNEIKVTVKDTTVVVKTNADTNVQINGKDATLADVKVGNGISVRYTLDGSAASHVVIKTEVMRTEAGIGGTISSVDSAAHKISVSSEGKIVSLTLTNSTTIEINGKAATEADLKANLPIKVMYNPTSMEASKIYVSSMTYVKGKVKAVSTAENSVTISTEKGDVTVKVADSTKVSIRGVLQGIVGLTAGMEIVAEYDMATNVATSIKANAEEIKKVEVRLADTYGTIARIDAEAHKLSVKSSNGTTLTLTVVNSTGMELNGRAAREADLKANFLVKVVYNPATMELLKLSASSITYVEGKVKSVNTAENSVTITSKTGDVTLKVTDSTKVYIRGTLRGLIGLAAGMEIGAEYDLSTNAAITIKASAEEPQPTKTPVVQNTIADARGTITLVTVANGYATGGYVSIKRITNGETLSLKITEKTKIKFESGAVAILKLGDNVKIIFDTKTMTATEIQILN